MDSYDQLNELVVILQKWRDITNFTQGTKLPPIEPRDVFEIVNQHPEQLQDVINLARSDPRSMGITDHIPDDFTESYVQELLKEWRSLPSDYNLSEHRATESLICTYIYLALLSST